MNAPFGGAAANRRAGNLTDPVGNLTDPVGNLADPARTVVIANIGVLVTHDPAHPRVLGDQPDGRPDFGTGLTGAWLVLGPGSDGVARVLRTGTGHPPAADGVMDVEGATVIPGFVDSHTHMVFAGDRSAEFAARMAGAPYQAGGIATTIEATRAASAEQLRQGLRRRVAESRAQGITTREIKSGYAASTSGEARLLRMAREVTSHTTLLGAHVVPPEVDADAFVSLVVEEMTPACAELATRVDVFCERGAFDVDQSRAVLEAGATAGLTPTIHAGQLQAGPAVALAVELGCASADHCTHLTNEDVALLGSSSTVATLLPATDFSTRQPYPDARRLLDAGAVVALATNCNPGSSFTSAMALVIALAVRDCRMTLPEALWSATAGGATALRQSDIGHLQTGARADLAVVSAPTPDHLAYRPGMPLIDTTIEAGQVVWRATGAWPPA
nr:imidazolonepropionase [Euzebya tangerina]